jgi:hypothetical protein
LIRRNSSEATCFFKRLQVSLWTGVSKSNTTRCTLFTLALLVLFAQAAAAQSVLNFGRAVYDGRLDTGVVITNPNPYPASVQLTFYGPDGNPIANGMVNPVNYQIGPKSELQMFLHELFIANGGDGWIQATSTSSGLAGFYFSGDFSSTLDGSESLSPLLSQAIPLIREEQNTHTDLMIINPNATSANVTATFYNIRGEEIGTRPIALAGHGSFRFRPSAFFPIIGSAGTSARLTSTVPVSALAIVDATDSLMFVNGEAVDQNATVRVVPHFISGNGSNSQLLLSNPNAFPVEATVTLYSRDGGAVHPSKTGPSSIKVTIAPHGLRSLDAATIAELPQSPLVNGWIRVDTENVALNGVAVLDTGEALSAIPMQRASLDRMMFSQLTDSSALFTELDLVNTDTVAGTLDVSLLRTDGTLLVQKRLSISANSKLTSQVRDLIPEAAYQNDGFIYIHSSIGIYGVEMLGGKNLRFLATVAPHRMTSDFIPNTIPDLPQITRIEPGLEIVPGSSLRLTVTGATGDTQVLLGNLALVPRFPSPDLATMIVNVPPAIELGYARVSGVESPALTLHIVAIDDLLTPIHGMAFYQKIDVTDAGLDLNHPSMSPIRNARVEVVDPVTQTVISVSETGDRGLFIADVPAAIPVTIRVISRLRSTSLQVLDNTENNALYSLSTAFDTRENSDARIIDRTRTSGAFNILEMIQRGNDLLRLSDLSAIPPTPTIFWSTRNVPVPGDVRLGQVKTTYFSLATNTAYILGDRGTSAQPDSDEYDDSVIIHEYAHMLAARFSRDDSPGGWHAIGQDLDPRLAWSEGFANFFSGAVRNDPIYRDSKGLNGSSILRIDLEDNQPPNDKPGYGSEASVESLLWDLFDASNDPGDAVQYPFASIWAAIADLKNEHFVYLPYFLERFLARNPSETEAVRTMVLLRSIDFQPNVRPSVTNPWPRPVSIGTPATGFVDSFTSKIDHLQKSAHFFTFTIPATQMVAIRMDISGLGPANNPGANDLDIFLMDTNGNLMDGSDRGLNGQSELITRRLAAGTYMVEIRSYYTKAETNGKVYNSGDYRLTITTQ